MNTMTRVMMNIECLHKVEWVGKKKREIENEVYTMVYSYRKGKA